MILEQFIKWEQEQEQQKPNNDLFMRFAEEQMVGEHSSEVMKKMMYSIYQVECCLEGIIEDMEFRYEEKPKKKQSKKSNDRVEKRATA